jgi:hypothetical protein
MSQCHYIHLDICSTSERSLEAGTRGKSKLECHFFLEAKDHCSVTS